MSPTLNLVQNIHVINAEPTFLPHLRKLHANFPRLRIVLEHATTRAAVETVKSLGATVACTITAHHLALTVDDWAGQSWNYCKPVAKFPDDREALRQVIREGEVEPSCERDTEALTGLGHPRFFLGSDSAPHPSMKKSTSSPDQGCAAGIYTSPILLPLTAHLLESFGALDKLEGFVSKNGRAFYKKEIVSGDGNDIVRLRRRKAGVAGTYSLEGEVVVSFWAGKDLEWEIDYQG